MKFMKFIDGNFQQVERQVHVTLTKPLESRCLLAGNSYLNLSNLVGSLVRFFFSLF